MSAKLTPIAVWRMRISSAAGLPGSRSTIFMTSGAPSVSTMTVLGTFHFPSGRYGQIEARAVGLVRPRVGRIRLQLDDEVVAHRALDVVLVEEGRSRHENLGGEKQLAPDRSLYLAERRARKRPAHGAEHLADH